MSESEDTKGSKVEIFHRLKHLKARVGGDPNSDEAGQIDPECIAQADACIENFCTECKSLISEILQRLRLEWEGMKVNSCAQDKEKYGQNVFTLAHEIKDISAMCKYPLIADFAESLRDYILNSELSQTAHTIIIQAHIDAMQTAFNNDIKTDTHPATKELKAAVRMAIDKHG